MTGKRPRRRSHSRKRKSGQVVTYYFYDRRAEGEPDIPLSTDFEEAVKKWAEIHLDNPALGRHVGGGGVQGMGIRPRVGPAHYTNKNTSAG